MNDIEETQKNSLNSEDLNKSNIFTTVTTFSRYLSIVLFITLPFVGLWVGFEYGKSQSKESEYYNSEYNKEIEKQVTNGTFDGDIVFDQIDFILNGLMEVQELQFLTDEIQSRDFAWRYHNDDNLPIVDLVKGHSVSVTDLSFQDQDDEYGSYVFRLDKAVQDFFIGHNFQLNSSNSFSFNNNQSSQLGFRQETSNIVCIRNIEDTGSEFLKYYITCGYLGKNYEVMQDQQIVEGMGVVKDNESLRIFECDVMSNLESADDCYMQNAQSRKDERLCNFVFDADEKEMCLEFSKTEIEVEEIEVGDLGISNSIVPIGRDVTREFSVQVSGTTTPLKIDLYQVDESGNKTKPIGQLLDDGKKGDISSGDNIYTGIFEFGMYLNEQTTWYIAEVSVPKNEKITTKPVRLVATSFPVDGLDYSKFETISDSQNGSKVFKGLLNIAFMVGTESGKVKEIVSNLGGEVLRFSMALDDVDLYAVYFSEADTINELKLITLKLKLYSEVDFAGFDVLVDIE